jgi:methylated-DNA-protein-cysteine methyltransferase-like protein
VNDDPADSSERQTEAVYAYVRSIPPGRVLSYGDVGQAVGVGARSVGWALSFCPPDVPWQRVVGADGYLRIAKRSPHLKLRQKQLLEGEGVVFDDKERVERRFFLDAVDGDEAFPSLPQTELTL